MVKREIVDLDDLALESECMREALRDWREAKIATKKAIEVAYLAIQAAVDAGKAEEAFHQKVEEIAAIEDFSRRA